MKVNPPEIKYVDTGAGGRQNVTISELGKALAQEIFKELKNLNLADQKEPVQQEKAGMGGSIIREKIYMILSDPSVQDEDDLEDNVDQLMELIDQHEDFIIGEDETPRQAEERVSALTLTSMELAEEAVRFHARNTVRAEQRSRKLKNQNRLKWLLEGA